MKFDYIIGNPPYQEENDANTRKSPLYNSFMDAAYELGNVVELITPARFLFNAGQTPKSWNQKMLNDPHLKVLHYEQDCSKIFPNTEIKGGVTITYRNAHEDCGPIGVFSHYRELETIRKKVNCESSLSDIIIGAVPYRFTDCMRKEHPESVNLIGKSFDLRTNVLDRLQEIVFFDNPPVDVQDSIKIVGIYHRKRAEKWILRRYVDVPENFDAYKVFLPKTNGAGTLGDVLSSPFVAPPCIGHTQSFISIGNFSTEWEAVALLKYIKTKFARTMLGILKITQDNSRLVWRFVPLQDFTPSSDIDWSQDLADIDRQLYAKYGLDESEIAFIESHVKEMA